MRAYFYNPMQLPGKDGQSACKAAAKIIGDTKAKLGASAKITLDVSEPHCGLDINADTNAAINIAQRAGLTRHDITDQPAAMT